MGDRGEGYAGSAWFRTEDQYKQVGQDVRLRFLYGSTDETGETRPCPRFAAAQQVFTANRHDFGFLCGHRRVELFISQGPPITVVRAYAYRRDSPKP